jgi:hypothetical protein
VVNCKFWVKNNLVGFDKKEMKRKNSGAVVVNNAPCTIS